MERAVVSRTGGKIQDGCGLPRLVSTAQGSGGHDVRVRRDQRPSRGPSPPTRRIQIVAPMTLHCSASPASDMVKCRGPRAVPWPENSPVLCPAVRMMWHKKRPLQLGEPQPAVQLDQKSGHLGQCHARFLPLAHSNQGT